MILERIKMLLSRIFPSSQPGSSDRLRAAASLHERSTQAVSEERKKTVQRTKTMRIVANALELRQRERDATQQLVSAALSRLDRRP